MIFLRRTTHLLLILIFSLNFASQLSARATAVRISREEYINRYKHIAMEHQQRYGIPASITMAQGILESDSGNSILARGSNNHFGIKCKSYWTGRTFTHTDDAPDECFRAYESVEESYEDHANFLDTSPRYDSLFLFAPTDYRSWARALKGAGYATAADYAPRLVKLIEDNKLYLLDMEASKLPSLERQRQEQRSSIEPSVAQEEVISGTERIIDPNNYHVAVNSAHGYNMYKVNGVLYILAKGGDTFDSVAKLFGLSPRVLRGYNDVPKGASLRKGEAIYLERKQTQWGGNTRQHRVLEGESIHSISQSYAIRESSIRKLNRLHKGETPSIGIAIRLR